MKIELAIVNKWDLRIVNTFSDLEDAYIINVIKYKKSNSEEKILAYYINSREHNETLHKLTMDGHYLIDYILIQKEKEGTSGYFTDGTHFYKKTGSTKTDVTIEELIEVNDTSLEKASQEIFSICFLYECYLELCNAKLNSLTTCKCIKKEDVDNFTTDLLWLSLNAIRYNVEFSYLENALSILEDLHICNNLCKKQNTYDGCNC